MKVGDTVMIVSSWSEFCGDLATIIEVEPVLVVVVLGDQRPLPLYGPHEVDVVVVSTGGTDIRDDVFFVTDGGDA